MIESSRQLEERIWSETPKDRVLRFYPEMKIKRFNYRWYILYLDNYHEPFVGPNKNYTDVWMDALSKCLEMNQD